MLGVHVQDELLAGGYQEFVASTVDDEEGIGRGGIHVGHLAQVSVHGVLQAEADEEVPGELARLPLFSMFHRKVDRGVDKLPGLFLRVYAFELHQCGGVRAEAVCFDEEGHQYPVHGAHHILRLHAVEDVVREGELQLAADAVRLVEHTYFIYFLRSNHILVILAPMAFSLRSMSS